MKVVQINYQKTFGMPNYSSERIGMDVQIDEGESAKEAIIKVKDWVEKIHIENNPQLYKQAIFVAKPTEILEDGLPVIQAKSECTCDVNNGLGFDLNCPIHGKKAKAKPTIVELKKYENAIKKGDEKTIKELESNYQFNVTENGQ